VARRCIFCEGTGRLTREHVIPQWMTDVLPEQLPWRGQDQTVVLLPPDSPPSSMDLGHREAPERFNASTIRAVCGSCNSGWMSTLEGSAQDALTSLVRGERRALEIPTIELVASWAIKTSLVAQLTSSAAAAALDDLYHQFFRDRRPSPNAFVWAGAVGHDDWGLRIEALSALYTDGNDDVTIDDPPNMLSVTIGLGSLLLHSVLTTLSSADCPPLEEMLTDGLIRLWPNPVPTTWPPPRPLNNAEAWYVSRSLGEWLT
jgi:hypothetical protein